MGALLLLMRSHVQITRRYESLVEIFHSRFSLLHRHDREVEERKWHPCARVKRLGGALNAVENYNSSTKSCVAPSGKI
jgi:hypothetical protein